MDTIVALATAPGRAGVAIVRVSGPVSWDLCAALSGGLPPPRRAVLRRLSDAAGGVLDTALVVVFEEGRSFTGEKVAEFHVHGGRAVIDAVLRECLVYPGVRLAEPGEFTRRAFEAGKLTLVEVEGLADLLAAETESQRRQAMRVATGAARDLVAQWRSDLLEATAMMTAALDFSDEELPEDMFDLVVTPLNRVISGLRREVQGFRAAEQIRDGFEVAIVGEVNAGKSTLLNALAGREAAITSEFAGTTRDVIEVRMDLGGIPVTLIDTAGLRSSDDPVERIGIERGKMRAAAADLRLYLKSTPEQDIHPQSDQDIVVLSKADIWGNDGVSGLTGQGIDILLRELQTRLSDRAAMPGHFAHLRQLRHLKAALDLLDGAVSALDGQAWELPAEDIRLAVRELDGIVGRLETEDVLGAVFSSFCIGK